MSIKSGVTSGTPAKILFGAGVYFQGVEYNETVAPTEEEIKAAIIGATQEGGTITITPELFAPEIDGVTVAVQELQIKNGEVATIETSFAELDADLIKHQVIGKTADSTDANYDVITSAEYITAGHFYEGFGYYGELLDGRPFIVVFKKALCTSGMTTEGKNKTNSVFKGTFACHSDVAYGTTKLPYAIFLYKKDKWTASNLEEVTA